MKSNSLPHPVLAKLVDLDERVAKQTAEAVKLESEVEFARRIIGNKIEVDIAEYAKVQAGFAALHASALQARQCADSMHGVLQSCKGWIEGLGASTKLHIVSAPPADLDLAVAEPKLAKLRAEFAQLRNTVPLAHDIAHKVAAYVHELGQHASPLLRGLGEGQALEVLWPGGPDSNRLNSGGFSSIDGNALYLAALLTPDALTETIMGAIADTAPMTRPELASRHARLTREINDLSFSVAYLRERAGLPLDPMMSPWHTLGVIESEQINGRAIIDVPPAAHEVHV